MGKITVVNIMQAPARPDEGIRDGFVHGGWGIPYQDSVIGSKMEITKNISANELLRAFFEKHPMKSAQ